jgi:positive phototaxis protein PixI
MVFDLLSPTKLAVSREEEQFLQFSLDSQTKGLLSVSQLTEVLTIPSGQILPIPHAMAWVMGVYNWRGEVLWMVDLRQLIGLRSLHQQSTIPSTDKAIVLRLPSQSGSCTSYQTLGLVVSRIENIEWCNPNLIEAPSSCTPRELIPFLRGSYLTSNSETLAVFEGQAILAAIPKP